MSLNLEFKKKNKAHRTTGTNGISDTNKTNGKSRTNGINDTKGFVALLLCFCCPLLMTLLLFFFSTSLLLKLRMQSQHLCRSHGLQTQEAILKNIKRLFRLNPKALQLENKKKKLKIKRAFYLATGNTLKVAKIQILLWQVHAKKKALADRQKRLLLKARKDASRILAQLKGSFFQELQKNLRTSSILLNLKPKTLKWAKIPLALDKNPLIRLAPTYHPQVGFSEQQKLPISWAFDLHIHFLGYKKFWTVQGRCVATLQTTKGDSSWIAHLRENLKGT